MGVWYQASVALDPRIKTWLKRVSITATGVGFIITSLWVISPFLFTVPLAVKADAAISYIKWMVNSHDLQRAPLQTAVANFEAVIVGGSEQGELVVKTVKNESNIMAFRLANIVEINPGLLASIAHNLKNELVTVEVFENRRRKEAVVWLRNDKALQSMLIKYDYVAVQEHPYHEKTGTFLKQYWSKLLKQ